MPSASNPSQHDLLHTLYSEHYGWLHAWLRKKLSCPHSAADLAQDTFFRLLSVPFELSVLKTPRAYLTTTATRLVIDEVRRRKVEQAYMDALALLQEDAHAVSPEQHLQTVETLTLIAQMLENLPEKARQAFMLSRLDNLTYPEIAAQLGVSSSMIKQYIARAMVHCYQIVYAEEPTA
ncbi:sigma-70 family RNA polymerase sigma factor [Herminiimonas arsenitoxidans]|uniref:sigma-70 family RNA polymerase sigma factor n=1 Tax=Herminiimonas arsenitoxidans TaxID=1809410 RepID=UPI000970E437|nr:sigma-70 family RNA polymerase sigma factor [Herminiimonas arsenitoxidans]